MKQNKYFFFRNDDVRNELDGSLIRITETFIKHGVPITHAVEPGNVTKEVNDWLLEKKRDHPGLIEIVQHGYNHRLNYKKMVNGKWRKGEFGGDRNYNEQFNDIKQGMDLMDAYYPDLWFKAFTFPFGSRNSDALKALDDLEYKVVNGGTSPKLNKRLFYVVGRLLKKEMLFDRKISWNLRYKPGTKLFQIDLNLGFIKSYVDEHVNSTMYDLDSMKTMTLQNMIYPTIGVLIHHRYHNTTEKLKLVEDYLVWCRSLPNIEFVTQEQVFRKFARP